MRFLQTRFIILHLLVDSALKKEVEKARREQRYLCKKTIFVGNYLNYG